MNEIYDPMLAAIQADEPVNVPGGTDSIPLKEEQHGKKKRRGSRGKGRSEPSLQNTPDLVEPPTPVEQHAQTDATESTESPLDLLPWAGRVYAFAKCTYEDGCAVLRDAPEMARKLLFANPKKTLLVAALITVGGVLVVRALKGNVHEDEQE